MSNFKKATPTVVKVFHLHRKPVRDRFQSTDIWLRLLILLFTQPQFPSKEFTWMRTARLSWTFRCLVCCVWLHSKCFPIPGSYIQLLYYVINTVIKLNMLCCRYVWWKKLITINGRMLCEELQQRWLIIYLVEYFLVFCSGSHPRPLQPQRKIKQFQQELGNKWFSIAEGTHSFWITEKAWQRDGSIPCTDLPLCGYIFSPR